MAQTKKGKGGFASNPELASEAGKKVARRATQKPPQKVLVGTNVVVKSRNG